MTKVSFSYADRQLNYRRKKMLKAFVTSLFTLEKRPFNAINYVFCSDEYILAINRQFLQHDYFTDIITFDLSDNQTITGEVYISVDRIKENAGLLSQSFEDELCRVVFHGALHLCGYKDKMKSEIQVMRNREAHYLRLYTQSFS